MKRLSALHVQRLLSTACGQAGGVRAFARKHKIPPSVVSESRTGRRPMSPVVLNALGLLTVVVVKVWYERRPS